MNSPVLAIDARDLSAESTAWESIYSDVLFVFGTDAADVIVGALFRLWNNAGDDAELYIVHQPERNLYVLMSARDGEAEIGFMDSRPSILEKQLSRRRPIRVVNPEPALGSKWLELFAANGIELTPK